MADTILVIEDERITRTNLINFLQAEGFETLEASNGRSGIALAQTHRPDLIICDILMPDLDGYDVLITLQGQMGTATIPFIFLTVSATEDGFRQGLALGADDYLSKPVTSDQLRTAIAAQLKKTKPVLGNLPEPLYETLAEDAMVHERSGSPGLTLTKSLSEKPHVPTVEMAKAKLLDTLCPILKQRLINLRKSVEDLQSLNPEKRASQNLQDEFVRLLSLVNEASALQRSLTSSNATDLLEVFLTKAQDFEEES